MSFEENFKQFVTRISNLKDSITTEEATKTSIIMPFFSLLGYDVFNPLEFLPEFVADVGIKKGEKVDYAILKDGEPVILIEAKSIDKNLDKHDSQLIRYFSASRAKFAILTNGIQYKFYTDIEEENRMDKEPFLNINLLNITSNQIIQLKRFAKESFDINSILDIASTLKYVNKFKEKLAKQIQEPTDDFVKYFLQNTYDGTKTQTVIERFRPLLQRALNEFINDTVSEKIAMALDTSNLENSTYANSMNNTKNNTTDEELEAYVIIKSLLSESTEVNKSDITYKNTESYFAILYKNNARNWICRLTFSENQKTLVLPDQNKNLVKYKINTIEDISQYADELTCVLKRYLSSQLTGNGEIISEPKSATPYKVRLLPRNVKRPGKNANSPKHGKPV